MAFIKVGNKILKFDGKVVTNDPVPPANPGDNGKTPTATPAKDMDGTMPS